MQRLIAFHGKAQSGKTTAAQYLVDNYGFVRTSFASPLRQMLRALGLTDFDLQGGKEVPHPLLGGKTPRYALQTLGTEWGRTLIAPDLWVNALEDKVRSWLLTEGNKVVIDDCRFANEAAAVRRLGGIVVAVIGETDDRGPSNHASEAGLPGVFIDFTIRNLRTPTFFDVVREIAHHE